MTNVIARQTPYEKDPNKNTTATYNEVVDHYKVLDRKYDQLKMVTYGLTDVGKPLQLAVLSAEKIFDPTEVRKSNKTVLLINNGIHPGEPEGMDASMMLARDLLANAALPKDVVICIIPVYNIDGQLNRGTSRVNQNGPLAYGFRGNAKNLDLNRDFIKTESANSLAFQQIFNNWKPEIFVDNHTSNGADYQYVMTLIPTQKDKLNPLLAGFMTDTMLPFLFEQMKTSGFEMTPYVNSIGETPESGIAGFLETPRYTTGYAALHNTIGFMPETHMLKSYQQRVESTYKLMEHFISLVSQHATLIRANKIKADQMTAAQSEFAINWKLNEKQYSMLPFKGYEAKYKLSEVSGKQRLYYDRNAPYEREIKFWNDYKPALTIVKPDAYIIPQAWQKVVNLLKVNGVEMHRLKRDTLLPLSVYYITDYKTLSKPFEGHYLHTNVVVQEVNQEMNFLEGDYIVYTNQPQNRYILETLEPQGVDSFFAWNFFDSILGQKEHFSDYVFEDEASKILRDNPELRQKFETMKTTDKQFSENADAQLEWVYKHSVYYERSHMRYPIARLYGAANFDLK